MTLKTAHKQAAQTRLTQSRGAKLSANGRFQALLIALLVVTWSLTGAHNAIMAEPLTGSLTEVTTADSTTPHLARDHSHHPVTVEPGDTAMTDQPRHQDHCADHCLSVMLPHANSAVISFEMSLRPELQPVHWQMWRADLTPPPPKSESFSTLA